MKKHLKLFCSLLAAAALMTGCGGQSKGAASGSSDTASASETTEVQEELVWAATHDINDLNPHLTAGAQTCQGIVYEGLVSNTADGIQPCLAESWEISDDNLTYTFHLREGVKFTDGADFNADAAKMNIDAVMENKEKYSSWMGVVGRFDSCEKIDDYTITINLTTPYYATLEELSMDRPFRFISPNCFIDGQTMNGVDGYIGTGPYILSEYETDQYAVFTANEDYWGGAPAIKKLTRKVLPDGQTILMALQKGEVNFMFTENGSNIIDAAGITDLVNDGELQVQHSGAVATKMLLTNTSADTPVADKAVRTALWYAIDRESLANVVMNGEDDPAYQLTGPDIPYCGFDLEKREFNIEEAGKILDEAGWKQKDGEEYRSKDGKVLEMNLVYFVDKAAYKTCCEYIQSTAKEAGIKIELIGEESSAVYDRRKTGNYDLMMDTTWGMPYEPHNTASILLPGTTYQYCTAGLDESEALYEKCNAVLESGDQSERETLYKEIFTTVHDEACIIPLTYSKILAIGPADLQGMHFVPSQYDYPFADLSF